MNKKGIVMIIIAAIIIVAGCYALINNKPNTAKNSPTVITSNNGQK